MVIWSNFPPKDTTSQFEHIVIQANEIKWENMPDGYDEKEFSQ